MSIIRSRRFLPLFATQFWGAFNDNMLKNALVMLITYRLAAQTGQSAQLLVTIALGIFQLPYFLFSATAGQLADKYDRARLVRIIKLAEIAIMLCATVGFFVKSIGFLLFVLFAMGAHSTFFSPIKYALLPQHLENHELLTGNAYIEAGTFLAILLGTITGGVLVLGPHGELVISLALLAVAIAGYGTSRYIPPAAAPDPTLAISRNIWKETWHIVGFSREDKKVFGCVLGASWFWFVGATYVTQFPPYVKDVLQADASVVTLFLTCFSIGIAAGSFLCNKLLRGEIHSTYVPMAAAGMAVFGLDFYFAGLAHAQNSAAALMSIAEFLREFSGWRILADLFMIALSAGLFIVPLYSIMQHRSAVHHRARIIAANNVMNAIFMLAAAFIVLFMLRLSFGIPSIFMCLAAANGAVAYYIRGLKE